VLLPAELREPQRNFNVVPLTWEVSQPAQAGRAPLAWWERSMFVRLSIASATLASGLILGNWFLSYPSHVPMAPADFATLAAPQGVAASTAVAAAPQQQALTQPAPAAIAGSDSRAWPDATVSRAPALQQSDANSQWALTRDLQAELFRLGCYSGPLDGRWTPALRYALQDFTVRVNATLPVAGPDVALLSLARGQKTSVCGTSATVSVSEQTAFGPAPDAGYLPDGSPTSLDGRMSLGATPGTGTAPKTSFSSRRASKDDRIFTHPLGQF